jgi:hypothetical protein
MTDQDRYANKPLLRLIESYALGVIGELPEDSDAAVRLVVQRVWENNDEDWMGTLRKELHWTPAIDATIRENWHAYREAAKSAGVENSALEFAKIFADAVEKADAED